MPASAQITTGGDGTIVNKTGDTFAIPGGTPSGTNLFHSFDKFNLTSTPSSTQVANFIQPNTSVQNILGRVTGGQPSSIDGKIQVTGGNANLFLMNPAGIVFGKNASLDVNGAFTATTARSIGFGDSQWFNALGGNIYPAGNPDKFAFTNTPGSIFNASSLQNIQTGKSITLVGGTVISTGDIKTAGGNISIATVQEGKYVRISGDGSILGFDLPVADKTTIDTNQPTLARVSLPALLTGDTTKTLATGVTVENNVVKLVGDTRSILQGDIVTKNLDTAGDITGGKLSLNTQTGNIITSVVKTNSTGESEFNPLAPYIHRGGNVFLNTQFGDIFVDSIDTSGGNFSGGGSIGGDVTINAGGLFRAIGLSEKSIFTGGNAANVNNGAKDSSFTLGRINITHQGTSFVVGGQAEINPEPSGATIVTLTKDFKFPEDASGTRGAILSRNTNGSFQVVYNNGSFSSSGNINGFGITSVARSVKDPIKDPVKDTIKDPVQNTIKDPVQDTDNGNSVGQSTTQASNPGDSEEEKQNSKKRKLKAKCNTNSSTIASNSGKDLIRSASNSSSLSEEPCPTVTGGTGGILQILINRE
jgi:filamentous hemagglutinin family protein